ncbi:chemotaxis protein CheA [Shewanella sp. NFH-SH190041]|uniref:chemotaxis protein CheA n=1 Tax=Shewanella sp. NFH-SH190041 TaxID=2950245 RepID=UPI0021C3CDE5|nr:chemotaxis protein CheA [Shewanella sp. NFH-SH190041]BDM62864.1 chemotaxis protein CheA [Shewanella sp. NFH-SH190041]
MDIDLSQFSQVFFEESIEGLAAMETELLNLNVDTPDDEAINTIFRSAHSIKGGSGTFGFTSVANFTHLLETLLDEIRDGRRKMLPEHVDMLLHSVDVLRGMLDALMAETEYSDPKLAELEQQLTATLAGENPPATISTDVTATTNSAISSAPSLAESGMQDWQIIFAGGEDIMRCGNDPMLMFNELRDIGELQVTLLTSELPQGDAFDAEACYLKWQLQLTTAQPLAKIKEAFEWVEDECDISYTPINSDQDEKETSSQPEAIATVEPVANIAPPTETTATTKAKPTKNKNTEGGSIRVSTDKIDTLINMVGELVITQAMLGQIGQQEEITQQSILMMQQGLEQLASHTRDLQESVMQIRMLPISFAFNRFPRLVRDTSQQLGKKVELVLRGEETELDKTVMEKIVDPMVHLVRNSLDHGLENPAERQAKGKPETGTITLEAYHQGGNIVIEIIDDGAGLNTAKILEKAISKGLVSPDEELSDDAIHQLIFKPGFSTADAVSDLSGRGVGMDVVKRNIHELNGTIELQSRRDQGSRFTIRLPLTLAILDGQLVRIGEHIYVVPLVSIYESLQVTEDRINRFNDEYELIRLRDEYVPVVKVHREFGHQARASDIKDGLVMVVDNSNEKVGLLVDELLAQQQVVIKNLEDNYTRIPGISGATILGNGTVALIIDVAGLVSLAGIGQGTENAA